MRRFNPTHRLRTAATLSAFAAVAITALLSGCTDEGSEVVVNVKSDLVPGIEFTAVELRLAAAQGTAARGTPPLEITEVLRTRVTGGATSEAAYVAGTPVGSFAGVSPGTYWVLASLLDDRGQVVVQRPTVVTIGDAAFGLTVLLTRDCRGVSCPAAGGAPELLACLAGQCVDPRCHPLAPEYCPPPECTADGDCSGGSSCAPPRCSDEGICLLGARSDMCAAGEYCGPDIGCLPTPVEAPVDAGMPSDVVCGTICFPPERPCFAGYYACEGDAGPVCSDLLQVAEGTPCGTGTCDATGTCVGMPATCTPGGRCWTGCMEGTVACAGDVRSCALGAANVAAGTICQAGLTCYDGEACDSAFTCDAGGLCEYPGPTRVSAGTGGVDSNGFSRRPQLSADGSTVVFDSNATNLVAVDANGNTSDIFAHDLATGVTELVTVSTTGVQSDQTSQSPRVSGDGRFVVFQTLSALIVPGDTNSLGDIFVRDRMLGTTERVNVNSADEEAIGGTSTASYISDDGRYVVFSSFATNLVAGDTNGQGDIFVRDRMLGTTERVSVGTGGTQATASSGLGMLSADASVVAFVSDASLDGFSGQTEVFVHDRTTMTTAAVSRSTAGAMPDSFSGQPWISADGRYVAFYSNASTLVTDDTNGTNDVFLHDRTAGTTTRISLSSTGDESAQASSSPHGTPDASLFVFTTSATNFDVDDGNGLADIYLIDMAAMNTRRISLAVGSEDPSAGNSTNGRISADGTSFCYESGASNLDGSDLNGSVDIFCSRIP